MSTLKELVVGVEGRWKMTLDLEYSQSSSTNSLVVVIAERSESRLWSKASEGSQLPVDDMQGVKVNRNT